MYQRIFIFSKVCAIFILEQIYLITKNKERLLVMKRENFGSRLGFILVSAGCAIGLGNVWKFPYMAGQYGGAAFILIYLLFLVILGLPIIVCEFSVGRASQKSIATSYNVLEPKERVGILQDGLQSPELSPCYVLFHGRRIGCFITASGWQKESLQALIPQ